MNPRINMRTFVTFFFCLSLLHPFGSEAKAKSGIDLIMEACNLEGSASGKKFCIETLKSDPSTANAKDSKTLAEIRVEMTKKQSSESIDLLKSIASKNPISAVKDCVTYFNDTIGMLNLRGLDDGTATLDIHYALDSVGRCETALADAKVHIEQISGTIQKWKDSFGVTFDVVYYAENGSTDD